ncbi:MAG: AEC family transporter [Alphaproteobacteria bacterium]
MNLVVTLIVPVFLSVLLGVAARYLRLIDAGGFKGLTSFVFNFAIPFSLFANLATAHLPAAIPWSYFVTYFGAGIMVYGIGLFLSRQVFRRPFAEAVPFAFGSVFSNTTLLGIPIVLGVWGESATLPLFLVIVLHAAIYFPPSTLLIEIGLGSRPHVMEMVRLIIKGLIHNPIVLALALGMVVAFFTIPVPEVVMRFLTLTAQAAGPCALFAMGGSLRLEGLHKVGGETAVAVLLKIVVHPVLVALLGFYVFHLDPLWAKVAVTMAALPSGINLFILADRYGVAVDRSAAIVTVGTAAALLTLSLLLPYLAAL